jgi:hypothetical protein
MQAPPMTVFSPFMAPRALMKLLQTNAHAVQSP